MQFSERDTGKPAASCHAPAAGVAVDPFDPSHQLRVNGIEVEYSVDGGNTWQHAWIDGYWPKSDSSRIRFSSDLPGLLYVGLNGNRESSAIFRSRDGGRTWQLIARLDGKLAAVRSARGTASDSTTVTVEICDRPNELVGFDHPW